MHYPTVNPQKLLENLVPAILDPENLLIKGNEKEFLTGLPYKEALGSFILSVSMNYSYGLKGENIRFKILSAEYEDDNNEDGAILIEFVNAGNSIVTYLEQVSVTPHQKDDITTELIKQIKKKHKHYSDEYFQTHSLIIFTDKIGAISVKGVKDFLRDEFKFGFYAIFCLEETKGKIYRYSIINLDPSKNRYGKFFVYVNTSDKTYEVSDRELAKY